MAIGFVVWSTISFLIQLARVEESGDALGDAANVVDDIGFIAWNAFVLWARLMPDDDGASVIFSWR